MHLDRVQEGETIAQIEAELTQIVACQVTGTREIDAIGEEHVLVARQTYFGQPLGKRWGHPVTPAAAPWARFAAFKPGNPPPGQMLGTVTHYAPSLRGTVRPECPCISRVSFSS